MTSNNLVDLYGQYANGLRVAHIAHFETAKIYVWRDRALGIGSVIISTMVGSSLFATINESPTTTWRIVAGVASLLAAVLAALSTFLRYEHLADRHQSAAVQYGGVRRQLETLVSNADDLRSVRDQVNEIITRWNEIDETAPPIPSRVHSRTLARVLAAPSIKLAEIGPADKGAADGRGDASPS